MTDRTEFESQCDAVAETLDNLSDWEKMFYLYCLLPWYIEKVKKYSKKLKTENLYEALQVDATRHLIDVLQTVRDSFAHDLF